MSRLYISQNNRDTELALLLAGHLQKRGHSVAVDASFLVPGTQWMRSIRDEAGACDGIIALLSENSVREQSNAISSQWVAADIGAARATGKFVIPLIVGATVAIPALVNDLFTIREDALDEVNIDRVADAIDKAVRVHIQTRDSRSALGLPPGFEHLASGVQRFHEDFGYDQSVFVMMKFPDPASTLPVDSELLEDIWITIDHVLNAYGLKARRADKRAYTDQLWENICIYSLGSRYGLAVLEDRVAAELNPNVALEYGFMKALNRQVALLRDIGFKHDRADLTGKLSLPFEIDKTKKLSRKSLARSVQNWLTDLGVHPREKLD
jgi:hypothetical protein